MLWLRLLSLSSESEPPLPRGLLSPPLDPPELRLVRVLEKATEEELDRFDDLGAFSEKEDALCFLAGGA